MKKEHESELWRISKAAPRARAAKPGYFCAIAGARLLSLHDRHGHADHGGR